jgi:hypothetical protein
MKQTLILLGLATLAICSPIKTKLGQIKSKTLAEQACSCAIPPGAVGSLPGLSSGTTSHWAHGAAVT